MKRLYPYGLILLMTVACSEKRSTTKPNIVFIFADDLTYRAIHALGNEEIETPNIDRLVYEGTTFTHAYNMGAWNGAVCVASRAMIISGRFVWRAQKFSEKWRQHNTNAYEQTWPRLLEGAGYDTYMTGKWHVAAPADTIFNQAKNIRPGMPGDSWSNSQVGEKFDKAHAEGKVDLDKIMPVGYNRPKHENDNSWSPTDPKFSGFWEGGKHWSEVLKDDALGFIEQAKGKPNPFFMYLAFNAPHDPRQASQEYFDKYPLDRITIPKNWLTEYPDKDGIGLSPKLRDEALAPFPRTEYAIKKHIQEYYAIITHLDDQIGQILSALEESGKMDNTYIFFTADHGLAVGRHGLLGKQNMYDHSIRVPLMVKGPGIAKGNGVTSNVYLQDVMATSLELAGITKPNYVEFKSFLSHAKGESSEQIYPSIYCGYIDLQRMIRKDGFKLIVYPKIGKVKLFDMQNDPDEMNNLSEKSEYKTKIKSLFDDLLALQNEMDDELDISAVYETL